MCAHLQHKEGLVIDCIEDIKRMCVPPLERNPLFLAKAPSKQGKTYERFTAMLFLTDLPQHSL